MHDLTNICQNVRRIEYKYLCLSVLSDHLAGRLSTSKICIASSGVNFCLKSCPGTCPNFEYVPRFPFNSHHNLLCFDLYMKAT